MSTPAIDTGSESTTGRVVSRAVLYFGVASVVLVWASAFSCLMCHCMRRRRRSQAAPAGGDGQQAPAEQQGAQHHFPTQLPVVILNPDNTSLELGIKEEVAYSYPLNTSGGGAQAAAGSGKGNPSPPGTVAGGCTLPPPPPPQGLQQWPPQECLQQQQWMQQTALPWQYAIQMGQAGVWIEEGGYAQEARGGASCSSSSSSSISGGSAGSSRSTGGAWGYRDVR